MAFYFSKGRYSCLSTDLKLTDGIELNSLCEETDTGNEFIFNGAVWRPHSQPVSVAGRLPNYIIPMMSLLAWSGFTNQPANDGVEIVSDSASDVGLCTVFGTTHVGGAFAYETVTLTGSNAKSTTKTDWGNVYGIFLGDIYGQNTTPAVGTITIREASADQTITTLAAAAISKGMVAFNLANKDIILNVHSGNVWKCQSGVVTTANGFKLNLTGGNIKDERVSSWIYLISDTAGATCQIEVQA
jgi:hypothetical protein